MLAAGAGLPPAKLRKLAVATRERLEECPRQERSDVAAHGRRTVLDALPDGMAWLGIYAKAEVVVMAKARIDANAERLGRVSQSS